MGAILGAVGGLLGVGGGANGTGFAGPSQANIQTPTTTAQAQTAYNQNQTALQQQQSFLNALQGQNGIGNQSQVYNQLQQVASGQGPNPATAQLAQATAANTQNQAALMAGQRGASQNAGLIARQAAQQGAANQQAAAGQAATTQAQQSLGALQQLGGLSTQQVGQQAAATGAVTGANQAEQQNLLNSIAGQNNANVGMQSNINSTNAGLAGQAMQGQMGVLGGVASGAGSLLGGIFAKGGIVPHYDSGGQVQAGSGQYAPVDPNNDPFNTSSSTTPAPSSASTPPPPAHPQQPSNQPKSALANTLKGNSFNLAPQNNAGAQAIQQGLGSLGQSIGNWLKSSPKASTSEDDQSGGLFTAQNQQAENEASGLPLYPQQMTTDQQLNLQGQTQQGAADNSDDSQFNAAKGGKVPAMVSPGEVYLDPKDVQKVKQGADPIKAGEKIPGKAKVKGAKNSYANDTVPKTLDEGGIVLPRSVTQAKHPHWEAHRFIKALAAKNGGKL